MARAARTAKHFTTTVFRDIREINLHRGHGEKNIYTSNAISTGKYSAFSLVPKNLFEQFKRVANIWFLIVSILQLLPLQLSPTSSWATIAPLSLVLAVTLLKDAYLDYRRHMSDREINNRVVHRWNDELGDFEEIHWCDLEVGNVVRLSPNEQVPADLIILATGENDYICYIETSNLDGESNLKIRSGIPDTAKIFTSPQSEDVKISIRKLDSGSVRSEKPNNRLYRFEGTIRLLDHIMPVPLDNNNVILRGCALKNTSWVLAVVIFTGADCKLMMNSKAPPHKRSNVERRVNRYLAIVFGLLFATSGLSTIISVIYNSSSPATLQYFSQQNTNQSGLNFITFMILYNGLVPISLYVTMDIVRVVQAKFIQWDLRMYHAETDRAAIAKTADLNEDLGQIEYIFSDKTGTLTENQMMFKKCSIRGKVYGNDVDEEKTCVLQPHPKFQFSDPSLLADLQNPHVREFLECLALCHTVMPDRRSDGAVAYQAASPDEEALVLAASSFGFTFVSSRGEFCALEIEGKRKEYRLLGVNEFNSNRKRMSVVIKAVGEGEPAMLLCKGADNVMMGLCHMHDAEEIRLINQQQFDFAVQGLRTLVIGKRMLTKEQEDDFETKWINAKKAIADREKRLEEVAEEFETDLELLGITAIEDKVQEKVPETIASLRAAGIKVWVLTGDKQETAINIGYACRLLTQEMTVVVLTGADLEEVKSKLKHFVGRFVHSAEGSETDLRRVPSQPMPSNTPSSPFMSEGRSPSRPFGMGRAVVTVDERAHVDLENINIGLIVNGESLQIILGDNQCIKWFTILACISKSVICCRATPLQKAKVVQLIKSYVSFRPITLAVGDGANDVSMIQEAHVGVGIIGNEGMQAVNCSDYAIARFHFLLPLLFLHGRWNYHRITKVILYSFYKNFLLILPMFYYSFLNLYSGTALYDSWLIMSYNVFFTSLPIIVLGASDTDSNANKLLHSPSSYTSGILSMYFNAKVFIRWVVMALVHSLLIHVLIVLPSSHFVDTDGSPEGLAASGTVAFYAIVQCVTYVILLNAKGWNRNFLLAVAFSLLFFYPFIFFYDFTMFPAKNMIGVSTFLFSCPSNLLSMWLTPVVMIAYNFTTWYMHTYFKKTEKINPAQTYVLNSPRSVMLRAGKYIQLNKIVSFKGLTEKVEDELDDDFNYNKWTLHFHDSHFEYSFRRFQISRRLRFMRVMFWVFLVFLLAAVVSDMETTDRSTVYTGLRIALLVAMFCICLFAHTRLFTKHYELIILVLVVGGMAAKIASDLMLSNDGSMSTAVVPIITFVLFNISTFKLIVLNSLFMVVYLIKIIVTLSNSESSVLDLIIIVLSYFALLWGITAVSAYVGYTLERESRDAFVGRRQLEGEYRRGQEMLSNLLPKFVKDRVKSGERNIADDQGVLTVLFCDIYEFEELCEDPSLNLVQFLNNYFQELDSLVERFGLTKIETVNKSYMVCAGLKANEEHFAPSLLEKHHSVRVIEFAFQVLQRLKYVTRGAGKKVSVKIGAHMGQVFSGVVGLHKPQFSLVGDTINYASRMCAFGQKDRVQISMELYKCVRDMDWEFTPSVAKIKEGLVDTMLVAPKQQANIVKKISGLYSMSAAAMDFVQQQPVKEPKRKRSTSDSKVLDTSVVPLISSTDGVEMQPTLVVKPELQSLESVEVWPWQLSENEVQRDYRIFYVDFHLRSIVRGLWMTICIYILDNAIFITAFVLTEGSHGSPMQVALRLLCMLGMVALIFISKYFHKSRLLPWCTITLYTCCSFVSVLMLYTIQSKFVYVIVLEVMYTNVIYNHISGIAFKYIVIGSLCILAPWVSIASTFGLDSSVAVETTLFVFLFTVLNGAASYAREWQNRKTYILTAMQNEEKMRTENLLMKMMPKQVYIMMQTQKEISPFDIYEKTTILYADICGFTIWGKNKSPAEVVGMLSRLYSNFDNLTVKHHVYKVHTIGDCYVVLGLSDQEQSHRDFPTECQNVVNLSMDMVRSIKQLNQEVEGLNIGMRIGIHTGKITGAFAGTIVVRYDIYGAAVTKANKMESGGTKNRINVSYKTKQLLQEKCPDRFDYLPNDKNLIYEPKNKPIPAFYLEPRDPSDVF